MIWYHIYPYCHNNTTYHEGFYGKVSKNTTHVNTITKEWLEIFLGGKREFCPLEIILPPLS